MSLAKEDLKTQLKMGGTSYALKKLKKWKSEGPTERNKQAARFLLQHSHFGAGPSYTLTKKASFLFNLALEWGDFSIWQKVLEKSVKGNSTPKLSLDILTRASSVFTFDRTKNMSVHSTRSSFAI